MWFKRNTDGWRGWRGYLVVAAVTCHLLSPSAAADPLRIVSVSDAPRNKESMKGADVFLNHLESGYTISLAHINVGDPQSDLSALEDCDVILFHPRGPIPDVRLDRLRVHLENGPPLVALRGAVHAFGGESGFDRKVLGARYSGQHEEGLTTRTRPAAEGEKHPIFEGVAPIRLRDNLQRFEEFSKDVTPLMIGAVPGSPPQTIAWTRQQGERRIFHASLGGDHDFENDSVKRLIANALFWAARINPQRIRLPELARWERKQGDLTVPLRSRKQAGEGGGNAWRESVDPVTLPVDVSALIVADMRDAHWCASAAAQVDAMAEKVNQLVSAARKAGMLIVHVPSETTSFYDYHPARRRVEEIAALTVEGNYPIGPSRTREVALPPMPIANSNCPGGGNPYPAWTRQHPAIAIHDTDIISGVGLQLYSYLLGNGIDTLFYVGIHANTTLIDRSYGMRQMSEWEMDCVLIRDLTDIMFDPQAPPRMPHDLALQQVIEHLEKHLLPTVTSQELTEALGKITP
jgi:nicotinamidase-related amidase